ncbi:RluA family pseudouridine synthase [Ethanoligenens sp.]|uniref:RluA family pseudouridine synthase n=1 Tax=Ethanoligenens sp. TaxID=2099655 RepID=UPI0039E7A5E2
MTRQAFLVGIEQAGERLDKALARLCPEQTRSGLQKLMASGQVTVNGKPGGKHDRLRAGDEIIIVFPDPVPLEAKAQNIPLDIVYEDNDLLVVNKPQGMVVHPGAGNPDGTLVNALLFHCGDSLSGIGGVLRPGIVHRIDKDTSGLLMVAKNDHAHQSLAAQIKAHSFLREYEAVVCGIVKEDTGTVSAPVGRHPTQRKRMAVTQKNSRPAVTHYTVLRRYARYTHVRLRLETGRTHQIRLHMAYIGHSVAGDPVYGKALRGLRGQCLHARTLGFIHPSTGKYMEFTSDLPAYFQQFLHTLAG